MDSNLSADDEAWFDALNLPPIVPRSRGVKARHPSDDSVVITIPDAKRILREVGSREGIPPEHVERVIAQVIGPTDGGKLSVSRATLAKHGFGVEAVETEKAGGATLEAMRAMFTEVLAGVTQKVEVVAEPPRPPRLSTSTIVRDAAGRATGTVTTFEDVS